MWGIETITTKAAMQKISVTFIFVVFPLWGWKLVFSSVCLRRSNIKS